MNARIKELRKKLGLNQTEFAEKFGATQQSVAGWENGARNIPESRILQICQTFGVRREWLETGAGEIFDRNDRISKEDKRAIQRAFVVEMWARLTPEQQAIILEGLKEIGINPEPKERPTTSKTAIVGDNNSGVNINQ